MLSCAEKYNWWTPQSAKADISIDTKIEYILEHGTLDELRQAVREAGGARVYAVWKERIEQRHLKHRHFMLSYFVNAHRDDSVVPTSS